MKLTKQAALLAVLCIALLGAGCDNRKMPQAMTATKTDNSQIVVEYVLTHEGVKVYRFWDGYRYIYYTDARGVTQWREVIPQGKTSRIEDHAVENVR